MTSAGSVHSFRSGRSQNVLDEVASLTTSKIYSLEGIFSSEEMRVAWNGFGLYISKNMRMGRGVNVPKYGIFTFTPPEIRLKGVTNPNERDLRPRNPVFIISKDFVKGVNIKSGIFFHQEFGSGMRAYSLYGSNGQVPIAKANFTQVASYANMTKDNAETAVLRIIKHLSQKARTSGNCIMDIPSVGTFMVRNGIAAVKFNQFLQRDTRNVLSQSLDQRKTRGNFSLTKDNLQKFAILNQTHERLADKPLDFLKIDENAKSFLKSEMGLFFDDNNPMRRTITGFDRSLNTRNFKGNSSMMMQSQTQKFNQSMMRKTLGSSSGGFRNTMKYDYNMALKLLRQWIFGKAINSEQAFLQFMQLSKGKKDLMAVLSDTDVWNGCKQISLDITEQQAHQLFRLLDFNKDGVVSLEDWIHIIRFDSNHLLRKLKKFLSHQKLNNSQILIKSGLQGLKNVDVFKLQKALLKLSNELKEQQAYNLARYLCGDDRTASVEMVLDQIGTFEEQPVRIKVSSDWERKFLQRIKKAMIRSDIFQEQLSNKFQIYDSKRTGQISQSQFKDVLTSLGISLTVTQIIKAMKQLSVSNQMINYQQFIDKLKDIQVQSFDQAEIDFDQFLQKIQPMIQKGDFGIKLPISIAALASELQSKIFADENQSTIKKHLQTLDIDKNGFISKQDINAFKFNRTEIIRTQNFTPEQILNLIKQLKQKLTAKRISLHQLFKMLDVNKNGFITPTEWDRLDKVFPMNQSTRRILFEHIDTQKLSMIDYRAFLDAMETNTKKTNEEKFDWVENCLAKIKDWFSKSNLLPAEAFKVVDRDFDSYIGSKDLIEFLQNTIKYQPREINHGRIQKLLKVIDTYKRGKVDMVDFVKILTSQRQNSWIDNAKQQIGLAISRKFKSLNHAFNEIGRTQKNLLFSNFQKWIQTNGILNGFMINQNMLKQLFASLDPHKKGYLSESDFNLAFGSFDWKSSLSIQFLETLQTKFKDIKEAFKHLSNYNNNNTLTKEQFSAALSQIFGGRFKHGDENQLWRQIAASKPSLTFQRFNQMFGRKWQSRTDALDRDYPRDAWAYKDYDIIRGTVSRSLQHGFNQSDDIETQCKKMVETVKGILRTSPKTLQEAFLELDKNNRGVVTNLQFRHALRSLNIALTSKQIDLLLNFCDVSSEGSINWRNFVKKFQVIGDRKSIIDRTKSKMQKLNDNIYFYLISPKDAYRKYNNPTTGYMSFEEFYKMVKDIAGLSNEPLPQYSIIKEIFDFIDVRGDDKLDYQQWVQTFRNYQPPSLIQGTRPPMESLKKSKSDDRLVPEFAQSPQFQELTKLLGRNRKYLLDKFQTVEKEGSMIKFDEAIKILKGLVSENGMKLQDEIYRNFLSFAMKGESVDYNLLLNSLKFRSQVISGFPKKAVF